MIVDKFKNSIMMEALAKFIGSLTQVNLLPLNALRMLKL